MRYLCRTACASPHYLSQANNKLKPKRWRDVKRSSPPVVIDATSMQRQCNAVIATTQWRRVMKSKLFVSAIVKVAKSKSVVSRVIIMHSAIHSELRSLYSKLVRIYDAPQKWHVRLWFYRNVHHTYLNIFNCWHLRFRWKFWRFVINTHTNCILMSVILHIRFCVYVIMLKDHSRSKEYEDESSDAREASEHFLSFFLFYLQVFLLDIFE